MTMSCNYKLAVLCAPHANVGIITTEKAVTESTKVDHFNMKILF